MAISMPLSWAVSSLRVCVWMGELEGLVSRDLRDSCWACSGIEGLFSVLPFLEKGDTMVMAMQNRNRTPEMIWILRSEERWMEQWRNRIEGWVVDVFLTVWVW